MPKRTGSPKDKSRARERILASAERLLKAAPHRNITIQQVASASECAKGLVNYHFETKDALLSSVSDRIGARRQTDWTGAFAGSDVTAAVRASWDLVLQEASGRPSQMLDALATIGEDETVRSVKNQVGQHRDHLAAQAVGLLERAGFEPTIPAAELGALIACGIEGFVRAAASGASADLLEASYSALWAAVLSLTRPR